MARRRRAEEHPNHERWLVSYADFITLLFAFFVVMYSISSINEGKYKILSETLTQAFKQPEPSGVPISVGNEAPRTIAPQVGSEPKSGSSDAEGRGQPVDALQSISQEIRQAFGDLISNQQMTVRGNELWIEIELSSGLLFPSGDAIPDDRAFDIVEKVAGILAPFDNPIHVEGFTDDQPINTPRYPTNWELSASRAASVVRMLAMGGVNASRMAAVGYGEFQPVADNATPDGRARNRRVVLVVSRNLDVRRAVTGVGSGRAEPDAAMQRAGTQTATDGDGMTPRATGVNESSQAPRSDSLSPAATPTPGG